MEEIPIPLRSQPGVVRDGTPLSSDSYGDAQWCRFHRASPRKIWGYRSINKYLQGLPRALHEYALNALIYAHSGSAAHVERFTLDSDYNSSVITDRTPGALTASSDNLWQFSTGIKSGSAGNYLIGQVAPNLTNIANAAGGQLFYGDLFGTAALAAVSLLPAVYSATGGVTYLAPYTMAFGSNGFIMWSPDCTDFTVSGAGNAYVTSQKLVRGMPLRAGGGNSPAGLFWSLDALVRATYVGGTPTFQFDTLAGQSSILSAASVIEYDGIYYWLGADRMLMFNGVVREIPNNYNLDFFYDNLNTNYSNKVFAFKVPRFGEIWWCFPKGDSIEPNHAIIFNVRENTWYDTALPGSGRGAGVFSPVLSKPLLGGVDPQNYIASIAAINAGGTGYTVGDTLTVSGGIFSIAAELTVSTVSSGVITAVTITNAGSYTGTPTNPVAVTGGTGTGATFNLTFAQPYKFWVHEVGLDEVDGGSIQPIPSYFETGDISIPLNLPIMNPPLNRTVQVTMLEPDFNQVGDMTVMATGRSSARAPDVESGAMTFAPDTETVNFKAQRRQLRFRFESNAVGGDYEMGLTLAHVKPGDGRTRP